MGPLYGRRLGVFPWRGVRMGIGVSVGLDALPLRHLGFSAWIWLGMAARRRVDRMVRTAARCESAGRFCRSQGSSEWDRNVNCEPWNRTHDRLGEQGGDPE